MEQANKLLHSAPQRDIPALALELMPNSTQWTTALKPFVSQLPNPSISIIKPLGGAISLISRTVSEVVDLRSIERDLDGYSPAMRMALYVTKMLSLTTIFDHTTEDQRVVLFQNLALFTQLASHNISIPGSVPLWVYKDSDLESEITIFSTDIRTLQLHWIRDFDSLDKGFVQTVRKRLLDESRGISVTSYYSGCACSFIETEFVESYGDITSEEDSKELGTMLSSPDVFTKSALLASVSDLELLLRFCKKLINDLTDYDFHKEPYRGRSANIRHGNRLTITGLRDLVFLNCIVDTREDLVAQIPPLRLIFFAKHVISQFQNQETSPPIQTEMMKILKVALVPFREVSGAFWKDIIDISMSSWSNDQIKDDEIPLLHASLRLFETLKMLTPQNSNVDLQDCLREKRELLDEGLMKLLTCLQGMSI